MCELEGVKEREDRERGHTQSERLRVCVSERKRERTETE